MAHNGSNRAVLGITASPQEYDDYIDLLIKNPRLGHTYKAYFGDIYQLDARLLPQFDYVSLFHLGEYRTPENDAYGALTDLEMTLILAEKTRPGGEVLFYSGSFAYDKAEAVGKEAREDAAVRAGSRLQEPAHHQEARALTPRFPSPSCRRHASGMMGRGIRSSTRQGPLRPCRSGGFTSAR